MLPNPEDYPDFDPILLKCIGYLGMGGKEARRGLKELYNELVNSDQHRASPLHHQKVSQLQSSGGSGGSPSPVKSRPSSPLSLGRPSPVKNLDQVLVRGGEKSVTDLGGTLRGSLRKEVRLVPLKSVFKY